MQLVRLLLSQSPGQGLVGAQYQRTSCRSPSWAPAEFCRPDCSGFEMPTSEDHNKGVRFVSESHTSCESTSGESTPLPF